MRQVLGEWQVSIYVELLHGEGLVSRMALDIFLVASRLSLLAVE